MCIRDRCCAGLARCTVGAVELRWNLEMRRGETDPLGSDVVHVGEDGGDAAGGRASAGAGWRPGFQIG